MSASPIARQVTQSQVIPQSRKVIINDENQLPLDYSTTPGGTLFSTTPGGTRIVYERRFLMQMKTSPLAQTPPKNLPYIRGVTKSEDAAGDQQLHSPATSPPKIDKIDEEETVNPDHEPQFEMEI